MSEANAAGTTYDGATPLLTAATPITPGAHSLFFSIFDQGDQAWDSAVFVDNLRLGTVENVETECVSGAEPVDPDPGFFTFDDQATGNGNRAHLTGTVTCPEGELYKINVDLSQDATTGSGSDRGRCNGAEQPFRMVVRVNSGPGFVDSPPMAEACATGQTGTPSPARTLTNEDSICEPVSIVVIGGAAAPAASADGAPAPG